MSLNTNNNLNIVNSNIPNNFTVFLLKYNFISEIHTANKFDFFDFSTIKWKKINDYQMCLFFIEQLELFLVENILFQSDIEKQKSDAKFLYLSSQLLQAKNLVNNFPILQLIELIKEKYNNLIK